MTENHLAWIALNRIAGIGPILSHRLTKNFGSPVAVFRTSAEKLRACQGIGPELAERIAGCDWEKVGLQELDDCGQANCRVLTLEDSEYPEALRQIVCPPPVLYIRGALTPADRRALAMVGSRTPSQYGLAASREFSKGLVAAGITVVSGLARGIDAAAHIAALDAGGRTIAVLAHGLDQLYPREHQSLHDRLIQQGAVVSEFPLGMAPIAANFPRRNRIISGLAQGVLVVEAGVTSGSLITARWAVEQGREVFAVPGGFNATLSKGTHALIQDGAKLVTGLEDILEELALGKPPVTSTPSVPAETVTFNEIQSKIMQALDNTIQHIDQLAISTDQPIPTLLSELLALELKGLVVSSPGQRYQRT